MVNANLNFEKPLIELEDKINQMKALAAKSKKPDMAEQIKELEKKAAELKLELYEHLTPWQRVMVARHPKRPYAKDYMQGLFTGFLEMHGDRNFLDDAAIIGGVALLDKTPVLLIGQQKGRDTKENLARNFGMPHPEGYRKALRLMKLAEKFGLPIISFIDTPGAYPGIGAEERGQAEAIARNLKEMTLLKVPIIVVIIGEGMSGGALAMAVGNRILMLENSIYSVISPEGCATILWKDRLQAPRAAESLKMTAHDLLKFEVIDEIISEPLGGAHCDYAGALQQVGKSLKKHLEELLGMSEEALLQDRYRRFRKLGSLKVEETK